MNAILLTEVFARAASPALVQALPHIVFTFAKRIRMTMSA